MIKWHNQIMECGIMAVVAGLLILGFSMFNCTGVNVSEEAITEFSIETLAIGIGIELKGNFEWTETTQAYYDAIMKGEISLGAAKIAEDYLARHIPPILVERLIRLSVLCGFDVAVNGVVGTDNVRMNYLQAAARGFRQGLIAMNGRGATSDAYRRPPFHLAADDNIYFKDGRFTVDDLEALSGQTMCE